MVNLIKPIQQTNPISFGYTTLLSKLWKKGKLPEVKKGFYGGELSRDIKSPDFCTNEHIIPHSKNGQTTLSNIVLATAKNNQNRGNEPLSKFFNKETFETYCQQFIDLIVPYKKGDKTKLFIGNDYVANIKKTVYTVLENEKKLNILG